MSLSKTETDCCLSEDKPCPTSIYDRRGSEIRCLCKPHIISPMTKVYRGFDAIEHNNKTEETKMNYEKYRIESFKNWPISWISVLEMAANGFYFKDISDVVECNFCHTKLHCWEAEDIPTEQHERWAPFCPFIRGEITKNVPLYKKSCLAKSVLNGSGAETTTV